MDDSQTAFVGDHATLAAEYLTLLLEGSRQTAVRLIVDAVRDGVDVKEIYLEVFQPVQYEVGRLWQINELTVAQEHVCTAITQLAMSQLYPQVFTDNSNGLCVVVGCVASDLHEVGARIIVDFFEMDGWDSHYLGANTPSESFASIVREKDADLVALSTTMSDHVPYVREAISAVRASSPRSKIMVGGYPFKTDSNLWHDVGADATANSADDAVKVGRQLVAQEDD